MLGPGRKPSSFLAIGLMRSAQITFRTPLQLICWRPVPSEFSIEVARGDADALDGIGRRDQHLKESGLFVVIYALNLDVIREARLAVNLRLQTVLGVEELRVWARWASATRHGKDQALEVP